MNPLSYNKTYLFSPIEFLFVPQQTFDTAIIRQLSNLQQLVELELSENIVCPLELPTRQDRPFVNLKRLEISIYQDDITGLTVDKFAQPILAWMPDLELLECFILEAARDHMEPILQAFQDGGVRCQRVYLWIHGQYRAILSVQITSYVIEKIW